MPSNLAGILRVEDTTRIITIPPVDLTSAVNALIGVYTAERDEALRLFVDGETTQRTEAIALGSIDEGQVLGPDGRPLETRPTGQVEVAYPWHRIGWAFGGNSETAAYMTVADMQRSVGAITGGNARRHVREIHRAFWGPANYTHTDYAGTLTIRRLANTDGTMYAPVVGYADEAEDNHYLASGYAAADISDANNPFVTLANEIREHYDSMETIVVFINSAQRADVLTGLTDFVDATPNGITRGADVDTAAALGGATVPGDFLGVDGDSGAYVYVWDRVPAAYMAAFAVNQPGALKRRVPDLAELRGFRLEAEEDHDPMWKRTYRERFGYGVANRLGAAVMQLRATGSYAVPTAYA